MIISIMNTIGSLRRATSTAASIITQNLQLWLGFKKADVLGAELVVDGDFPTGTTAWTFGSGWSLGTDKADATDADFSSSFTQSNAIAIVAGTEYQLSFDISNYVKGSIRIGVGNTWSNTFSSNDRFTVVLTASNTNSLKIETRAGGGGTTLSISNITVKEVAQFAPDKSTNTNNAKLFTGKALSFNGNDSVNIDSFSMAGTEATFAFWFYPTTTVGNVIDFDAGGSSERLALGLNLNNFKIYSGSLGGWVDFGSLSVNTWSRVIVTISGVTAKCYVNNTQLGSDVTIGAWDLSSMDKAKIGSNDGGTGSYISGKLSDLQIYNAAWDSDDVAYDYANPNNLAIDNPDATITKSNLIGYWALSEGSGSIAYDSSGEGNSGNVYDGSTLGATYVNKQPTIPQLGMVDWAKSTPVSTEVTLIEAPNDLGKDVLGNSLRLREGGFNLDGSGYGSIASDATLTAITNGTIQFWLKTSTTKFSVLNGQSSSEFIGQTDNGVWTDGNSGTITAYKDGSTASTSPVYDGAWHFYTFTGVNLSTWTSFLISNLTAFELDCIVDEVLIYDDVLTATEIDNNFNVSSPTHS